MSERPIIARPVNHETLADALSQALLDVPGVLRLEPTLKSTLARLRNASTHSLHKVTKTEEAATAARDGLHLTITGGVVNLIVELATDISHSAVTTAGKVQQRAAQTIEQAGLRAGTIDITILSVEGA